jgi:hypothetical protein
MLRTRIPLRQRTWPGFVVVFVSAVNEVWREKHFKTLLKVDGLWVSVLVRLVTAGSSVDSIVPEDRKSVRAFAFHEILTSPTFSSISCMIIIVLCQLEQVLTEPSSSSHKTLETVFFSN